MPPTGSQGSVLARLVVRMEDGMDDGIQDEAGVEVVAQNESDHEVASSEAETPVAPVEAAGREAVAAAPTGLGIGDVEDDEISQLLIALESADDVPLDERLQLLRGAEASIAGVLEGLDGL